MAVNQSSEALRRPLGALRLSFPVVVALSLVLGYVGFGQLLATNKEVSHRSVDLAYYSFQLFVLGADPFQSVPAPYPLLLEIARFSAPTATVYALIETARVLFSVELSRWRARRCRGHAIVCGDTRFADELTRRLQGQHTEVVEIRTQVDEFVTPGEPLRIIGDARDPTVLQAAGIEHADAVYACAQGSATNATIALAARRARSPNAGPVEVYSHIADPDLCATFQAAFLSRQELDGVRVDFFNINQIAARRLFDDDPLVPVAGRAPRVVVAGVTGFGLAAVVAAARSWRVSTDLTERLPLTLVGSGAGQALVDLAQRYPFLDQVCRLGSSELDLLQLLATGDAPDPPDRVLVCHRTEEHALKAAMAAERYWRTRVSSVVVRLERLGSALAAEQRDGTALLDDGSGVLRPFGVVAAACDPALIRQDLIERLAQVIHERYREGRRARGEWSPEDPSLAPWDRLAPPLREANRAQAEDIGRKLADVHCAISPRLSRDGDAVLSVADLELLARQEHERWCTEQERNGWRFDPVRSDERKLHPALRPWHALPEHFRQRCHDAVSELSDILADAGFRIVRG